MNPTLNKIETILTSKFETTGFVDFVREIFPGVRIIAPDKFNKEFTNFSSHIEGSSHVGSYTDPDGKILIIHSVQLKKESYVENSRSTQRSYAKRLIEAGNADAAIIAFYTDGDPKWRLSFVRLDYEIKFENGKITTDENMTPAKRYSYLVGKDEPCHTAISRFRRFILDDAEQPTLDDLEEAFSVEKVTEEFFTLYCEKFHQLREALEANPDFVIEAEQRGFTSAQFAKKLMGQIVFLYFLQKKGWLGVSALPTEMNAKEYKNAFFARGAKSRELLPKVYIQVAEDKYKRSAKAVEALSDEDERILASCVKGNPWGSGSKKFMRELFKFSQRKNANFFDDYLEPLFYNALNVNRGEQGYDPVLHCRIPFLSGGLFEPIDGYDWEHNDFAIPNEIFSNKKSDNDRDGDGILDIFDRYNFTMSEDEPLEREVAIDPEMLGKVFENLLEVNDRKSKGAFYTPREIVHYMCQESIIAYLVNETGLKEEDIRDFIQLGDFLKDEDTAKDKRSGFTDMLISKEIYKIDEDGKVVIDRLKDIDNSLANIRVADPAVGSGAFPLGMLNEIVRARQNISAYMAITMNAYETRMMYNNDRSPYKLKRDTIKNCIFAADIEPSAVDIARLRLWLSLVIDDEINPDAKSPLDGHKNPLPLPNLESNIVCGNSLVDEFEGIKLINYSDLIGTSRIGQQQNLDQRAFNAILPSLIQAQDDLFNCENTDKKQELKATIEALEKEIVESQLEGIDSRTRDRFEFSMKATSKPFVLWQIDFARVFKEKGGFDIVIGNPPYIQLQKSISDTKKLGDLYKDLGFETFTKTGDIYCLFYEKGYNLLRNNGVLSFITSNKWMRAGYGEKLRTFFANKTNPKLLIDFAGQKIFESATVDTNILLYEKANNTGATITCTAKEDCRNNMSVYISSTSSMSAFRGGDSWIILSPTEQSIKQKIEAVGTPLKDWDITINYGIKTGFNDAFIINGEKKDELIAADPKSAEIIRPILRGRDIKRYGYNFADLWLITTHNGVKENNIPPVDINDYPAIKEHLDNYYPKLMKRTDKGDTPYNLRNCVYMDDFSNQKIIYPETTQGAYFILDDGKFFIDKTCFMLISKYPEYILATLSSRLYEYAYKRIFSSIELGINGYQYNKHALLKLPIILASEIDDGTLLALKEKVIAIQNGRLEGEDTKSLERDIDEIICQLYSLSANERLLIGLKE